MNSGPPYRADPDSTSVLVRLARYLRANPLAGDTREGITQWWLGLDPSFTEQVTQALAWLEAEGLLEAVQQTDGLVHYRRTVQDAVTDARLDRLIRGNTVP